MDAARPIEQQRVAPPPRAEERPRPDAEERERQAGGEEFSRLMAEGAPAAAAPVPTAPGAAQARPADQGGAGEGAARPAAGPAGPASGVDVKTAGLTPPPVSDVALDATTAQAQPALPVVTGAAGAEVSATALPATLPAGTPGGGAAEAIVTAMARGTRPGPAADQAVTGGLDGPGAAPGAAGAAGQITAQTAAQTAAQTVEQNAGAGGEGASAAASTAAMGGEGTPAAQGGADVAAALASPADPGGFAGLLRPMSESGGGPTGATPLATAQPAAGPAPPPVMQQLADVVRLMPDGPVEIALSPEELGSVRMAMTQEGARLLVVVSVERPETYDLMRRNAEDLAQDLRDMGFDAVQVDVRQGGGEGAANPDRPPPLPPPAPPEAVPAPGQLANAATAAARAAPRVDAGGAATLDLRL